MGSFRPFFKVVRVLKKLKNLTISKIFETIPVIYSICNLKTRKYSRKQSLLKVQANLEIWPKFYKMKLENRVIYSICKITCILVEADLANFG